jgi:hypothetical protein
MAVYLPLPESISPLWSPRRNDDFFYMLFSLYTRNKLSHLSSTLVLLVQSHG